MKISIITINKNNALGLQKTMESVLNQTYKDFEYIVVDGSSTDESIEIIKSFKLNNFKWISEPDTGIYNAMNKGIQMSTGEYLQFLNSGDVLVDKTVLIDIVSKLNDEVNILYGNMLKPIKKRLHCDKGFEGRQPTMLDFYRGTLNHSPAYIGRTLFDTYGVYDESLKIVSDWKWFLEVIVIKGVDIHYLDRNITLFDMGGVSNTLKNIELEERELTLKKILPIGVYFDYSNYSFPIEQYQRIKKSKILYSIFYFIERVLFKFEKFRL